MNIGLVGGGINGLCCAWRLAEQGHQVKVYERDQIMGATSRASSKLLHGGLRYLENGEFRLVREALRERDAWLQRAPQFAKPIRLVMPIYRNARRPKWMIAVGLFLYDNIAGRSRLPNSKQLSAKEISQRDNALNTNGLLGGFEFSDGQMDDQALGIWVSEQAQKQGVKLAINSEVKAVDAEGNITTTVGET